LAKHRPIKPTQKGSRTGAGAQANEISQEIHRHTDYESRHVPESRLTNTTPAHRQKKMNTSYVSRVFETACQSVSQSVSLSVSQSVSQSVSNPSTTVMNKITSVKELRDSKTLTFPSSFIFLVLFLFSSSSSSTSSPSSSSSS
jgi:hypothetical protein